MARAPRKRLQFADWPEEDRRLWSAAFRTGDVFDDDRGSGAHLAERTRSGLLYHYECFLGFLAERHPDLLSLPPADRPNRVVIADFVSVRRQTCMDRTTAGDLRTLRYALVLICPANDWSWLLNIAKRIEARAPARPKRRHLVTSEQLYGLGIALMDQAGAGASMLSRPTKAQAFAYRDGLIIALLAMVPLRRRTVTALGTATHLVRAGSNWVLDIPAGDMKNRRDAEFPIAPELSARIDVYLSTFRGRIPGSDTHDGLWPSNLSRPMDGGAIYFMVRKRTRAALGFPVNLHRFRHAAATFWSIHDPANVRGVKDLLNHASFDTTTEGHYITSNSRIGGRVLAGVIDDYRQRSPRPPDP